MSFRILALVAASMLAASQNGVEAASPKLEETKRHLVDLACPRSEEGNLRVVALVYADATAELVGSRTYAIQYRRGKPSDVRYSIDAGRDGADVELFRGSFGPDGETVAEIRLGGDKAQIDATNRNVMRAMVAAATGVADEFCVDGAPSVRATALMADNRKSSGWPSRRPR